MKNVFDVIIIGAGPAGLFTAVNIRNSKDILVLEKNKYPGLKLLMSGSGKCNITQSGDVRNFLAHYGDNHRFLSTAINEFTNNHLTEYLKSHGIPTFTDRNGKIFPKSENAADILNMLLNQCKIKNIPVSCSENVNRVELNDGYFKINTNNETYSCTKLVITTGGKSYPTTGSTGDGYNFARALGHTIIKPKPALTPVYIRNYSFSEISGISLEDRKISLFRNNKKIKVHVGDIGFTHWGLSGPGILDFSRYIESNDVLKINLINTDNDNFRSIINETAANDGKMTLKRFLKMFELPESLIKQILNELNLDWVIHLADINRNNRNKIIELFCEYPFIVERTGDYNIAMVTSGGVSTKEVSSGTMESKLIKNLFFAGEVLDIDGPCGGYNLQWAFASGWLAGLAAAGALPK